MESDQGPQTRSSLLDNSVDINDENVGGMHVGVKRKQWARQSRESKKNPWKFPVASTDDCEQTYLMDSTQENKTENKPETTFEYECDCDDEESARESSWRACKCFMMVSMNIDSIDEIDGVCENDQPECLEAIRFVQNIPEETRKTVVQYLCSGNPEQLKINKDNLHHILHMARLLNLKQLYNYCMQFCVTGDMEEISHLLEGCYCEERVIQESRRGFHRFLSHIPKRDENAPPEYYIVFSKNDTKLTYKNSRIKVKVIDMSEKLDIFERDIDNMHPFGEDADCCSCYTKGSPYIYAGGGKGKYAQTFWKYDVLLGRWQKCAKMLNPRSHFTLLSDGNGSIYAIGGVETPSIEEYNIKSGKWTERICLINHVHSSVSAIYRNKIYIFGGKTQAGPVNTVQCYDTVTNKVDCIATLPCEFYDGQAVVFNDMIYIATGQGHLICFQPETGESHLCAQQPVQRTHFGMFLKYERVYLVGGVTRVKNSELTNDTTSEESAQTPLYRYNPDKDAWRAEPNLCQSFPVYSSCVISYPRHCPVVPFNDRTYRC